LNSDLNGTRPKLNKTYKSTGSLSKRRAAFFFDEFAREFYDDEHSQWENRFLLLGLSSHARLLIICHCYRAGEEVIRTVSARKATAKEARFYRR
jgi:hypothetical protein